MALEQISTYLQSVVRKQLNTLYVHETPRFRGVSFGACLYRYFKEPIKTNFILRLYANMTEQVPGNSKYHTPTQTVWLLLLAVVLTIFIYRPGLSGDYMFDDMYNLVENTRLDIDDLSLDSIEMASLSSRSGILRRPVSMFSFALNRYFFGTDPYYHKVVNLLIHLLTGTGIFILSHLLVRGYRQSNDCCLSERTAFWLPVVVSGLWLVHPLNLTSVLYIVQRMTSLAALFTIIGLCLYVAGRLRMLAGRRGLPIILAGLFIFGSLAIFSKESGALLPLYMLVIELALFRFKDRSGLFDKAIVAFFIATVAIPACIFIYHFANPEVLVGGYQAREFTLHERLLTETRVLVFYLKLIVMPSIAELGLFHDDIKLSHGLLNPPATLYAIMVLSTLLIGAIIVLGKQPLVALGILWFFASHALESTIIPLEIAHEHRNYLADYGIILAIVIIFARLPLRQHGQIIMTVTPALFLLLFSYTTWLRSEQWSDSISHAVYEARHHPESSRAVVLAGHAHTKLALNGQREHAEEAYNYFRAAAELDITAIMPEIFIIILNHQLSHQADPSLFDNIHHKLANFPITPADLRSLQELVLCTTKNCDIPRETLEPIFMLAIENTNNNHVLNAYAHTMYGYYLINTHGNATEGLKHFTSAVERAPKDPIHWVNVIRLLITMNKFDTAEIYLAKFREASTAGGSEKDYSELQDAISYGRKEQIQDITYPAGKIIS